MGRCGVAPKLCCIMILSMWILALPMIVIFYHTSGQQHSYLPLSSYSHVDIVQPLNNINNTNHVGQLLPKSGVKSVVILTYQRCGSTFFAEMFNTNPTAFYLFEPLDALYSSMYGTKLGFNVPTDINTYTNGARREVPWVELNAVSRYISKLFSCDIHALPTQTLMHPYFLNWKNEFLALSTYVQCLSDISKYYGLRTCDLLNPFYCGRRFGEHTDQTRLSDCRNILTGNDRVSERVSSATHRKYVLYLSCLTNRRKKIVGQCSHVLHSVCAKSKLRAAKTVRASMLSMELLLQSDPDFYVIHLLRDPRAVVTSRQATHDDSMLSKFTINSRGVNASTREAAAYCRTVVDDVTVSQRLQLKYPGRILTVNYEDVFEDVARHVDAIYRFLGVTMVPAEILSWVHNNSQQMQAEQQKPGYMSPLVKWRSVLSPKDNNTIVQEICRQFFTLVNYSDSYLTMTYQ